MPPARKLPRFVQTIRFGQRPLSYHLGARREFGDVWSVQLMSRIQTFVMTSHPDHVQSLFKAKQDDAHSLTGESPLNTSFPPVRTLTDS